VPACRSMTTAASQVFPRVATQPPLVPHRVRVDHYRDRCAATRFGWELDDHRTTVSLLGSPRERWRPAAAWAVHDVDNQFVMQVAPPLSADSTTAESVRQRDPARAGMPVRPWPPGE
jgi:hypothetical protein